MLERMTVHCLESGCIELYNVHPLRRPGCFSIVLPKISQVLLTPRLESLFAVLLKKIP